MVPSPDNPVLSLYNSIFALIFNIKQKLQHSITITGNSISDLEIILPFFCFEQSVQWHTKNAILHRLQTSPEVESETKYCNFHYIT